jgi:hypothetical protein
MKTEDSHRLNAHENRMRKQAWIGGATGAAAIIFSLLVGFWFYRFLLSPFGIVEFFHQLASVIKENINDPNKLDPVSFIEKYEFKEITIRMSESILFLSAFLGFIVLIYTTSFSLLMEYFFV